MSGFEDAREASQEALVLVVSEIGQILCIGRGLAQEALDAISVDLGGVHGAASGSVALDSLGLTIGQDYDFDLFFAERHTTQSNFRIDTSIQLKPVDPVPDTSSGLLLMTLGLGGIWAARTSLRKRKDA